MSQSSIPANKILDQIAKDLLIGGSWKPARSGKTFLVTDPASDQPIAEMADGDADDAFDALDAAHKAAKSWATTPPRTRGEILRKSFEILSDKADDAAYVMTMEMGKPVTESKGEIAYAAEFFRWFSEEAVRTDGQWVTSPVGGTRIMTMRQAVGPVLTITPWNFPMAMATRKVAPALAAGCTVVLKPSEYTPLCSAFMAQALLEAGLPEGVLNIVNTTHSSDTTAPLLKDERLRKLSFTGSTAVGKKLVEASATQLLRVSMELGGNAPLVVFEDADFDEAIEGTMMAKMRNGGQACTSANRIYVQAGIADRFISEFTKRMSEIKMGPGTTPGVTFGPLINERQRNKVIELVNDAIDKGAKALCGAQTPSGSGWFYPPTVLVDVPDNARLVQEEIFGPVAPIFKFETDDEIIQRANNTEYGLVAYVFTKNFDRAIKVFEGLETGMIGFNQGMVSNAAAPFGGVKHSGFGREGGHEGIDEYLETKYVAIKHT